MVKKKIYIAVETTQNEAQAIKRLKTWGVSQWPVGPYQVV